MYNHEKSPRYAIGNDRTFIFTNMLLISMFAKENYTPQTVSHGNVYISKNESIVKSLSLALVNL